MGTSSNEEKVQKSENMVDSLNDMIKEIRESDEYRRLVELFKNLPQSIQDTELFRHVMRFRNAEITYEDVKWMQSVFGMATYDMMVDAIHGKDGKTVLDEYILSIIESTTFSYREKLVILLVQFEELVYQTIIHERAPHDKVKTVVSEETMNIQDVEMESYRKILLAGVIFIVFSNTDSYKQNIDKRIPFRNNIVHRGTLSYSDDEVRIAYEVLVYFIYELEVMGKGFERALKKNYKR